MQNMFILSGFGAKPGKRRADEDDSAGPLLEHLVEKVADGVSCMHVVLTVS